MIGDRPWGVILVLSSFIVASYFWNLPFPWWIPFEVLCIATMFWGFQKVFRSRNNE